MAMSSAARTSSVPMRSFSTNRTSGAARNLRMVAPVPPISVPSPARRSALRIARFMRPKVWASPSTRRALRSGASASGHRSWSAGPVPVRPRRDRLAMPILVFLLLGRFDRVRRDDHKTRRAQDADNLQPGLVVGGFERVEDRVSPRLGHCIEFVLIRHPPPPPRAYAILVAPALHRSHWA